MPYQIKSLSNQHRAICRAVAQHGLNSGEVAEKFGLNKSSIHRLLGADLIKQEIAKQHTRADERAVAAMEDTSIIRELLARKGYSYVQDILEETIKDKDDTSAKRLKFDAARHSIDNFEKQSGLGEQEDPSIVMISNTQINLGNAPVGEVVDLIMSESLPRMKKVTPIPAEEDDG